jgi:hypothetical protein
MKPENPELDQEWLQLIQMERAIEKYKNQLLETGIERHEDPDEDSEPFWENEESLAKRDDHLYSEDLEYINVILDSFSRQSGNHRNPNDLILESLTPKDTLARIRITKDAARI